MTAAADEPGPAVPAQAESIAGAAEADATVAAAEGDGAEAGTGASDDEAPAAVSPDADRIAADRPASPAGDEVETAAPAAVDAEAPATDEAPAAGAGQPAATEAIAAAEAAVAGVEEQSALALIDDAELKGALEAILLVVDEPVTEIVLAQILEQPTERIAAMLVTVAEGYTAAGHGFDLRKVAGGWRLYTRPEYAPYVERFVLDGQSVRLTQAALETLAVVAYKQPVTRARISAIRGVNCDGVIRTLVSRGLVEECGTEPESGAFLYRTTTLFLEKLGLNSVNDLPPLAPFLPDDVEEVADATAS
ncbi:SMC-Scp complex subunit ScpB [Phytohabitans kaempferiae]|uniref:SMC-Scp complex subunit ScpB n=1 Tax=Phytohabitans kaempferiae TaxID=1620943 RepID=A0ABV6M7B8_9ACTN